LRTEEERKANEDKKAAWARMSNAEKMRVFVDTLKASKKDKADEPSI
jgi:hypothetical protein